jgi:protein-arginine kinase activator protein McsA
MSQVPEPKKLGTLRNQPDYKTGVERSKLEGQLRKLESLIKADCTREQSRNILGVSDQELDALLNKLTGRANSAKSQRRKSQPNKMSPKTLAAKRTCKKCGNQYTRNQGGTKTLCAICYERQDGESQSARAIPTAFESNRRRH